MVLKARISINKLLHSCFKKYYFKGIDLQENGGGGQKELNNIKIAWEGSTQYLQCLGL